MDPPSLHEATRVEPRDAPVLGLGGLFAVLVAVGLWATLVGVLAQELAFLPRTGPGKFLFVVAGTTVGGLGVGALAYARLRDLDLALSLPDSWPTALAVVLAPAVLVGGLALLGTLAGVPLSQMVQRWVSPQSPGTLLGLHLVWGLCQGVGYGLLFCVVVYERVRDLLGPEHAVVTATALSGLFWLLGIEPVQPLRLSVGGAVAFVLTLALGVIFGMALGVVHRHGEGAGSLGPVEVALLALGAFTALAAASELLPPAQGAGTLLWVATIALGILGYERTRSAWVPVAALTTLEVAITAGIYAEAALGIV